MLDWISHSKWGLKAMRKRSESDCIRGSPDACVHIGGFHDGLNFSSHHMFNHIIPHMFNYIG